MTEPLVQVGAHAKRLVICADDFGMNGAINAGILALVAAGRLSAVSCLTLAAAFQQDVARLAACAVDVGVHINFTERLGTQGGVYMPLPQLIARTYTHRLDKTHVRAQIAQQLDAFEEAFGRAPDFIDGHQHVHQLPQIRDALWPLLTQRYASNMPWVRCTRPGRLTGLPLATRYKAHLIATLGARALMRAARTLGVRTNRHLLGVYDFQGGEARYTQLLQNWLRYADQGDLLMCHPALPFSALDPMAVQRNAEYQALSHPRVATWLVEYGVDIGRYGP
jgi:predicted glycoside hydrolase/deacetylase ChbG (UPF0249 family)